MSRQICWLLCASFLVASVALGQSARQPKGWTPIRSSQSTSVKQVLKEESSESEEEGPSLRRLEPPEDVEEVPSKYYRLPKNFQLGQVPSTSRRKDREVKKTSRVFHQIGQPYNFRDSPETVILQSEEEPELIAPGQPLPAEALDIIEGEHYLDGEHYFHGEHYLEGQHVGCCPECGCDEWITHGHCDAGYPICASCENWCWSQDLTLFAGGQGFQGPIDLGANGNFGFHYGANYAVPWWHRLGIGTQLGGQVVHSNLSGASVLEQVASASDSRTQYFVTAGFFRRRWYDTCGWQWGVVADWLFDDYYEDLNLGQIRFEVSKTFWNKHEIGVWGASGVSESEITDPLNETVDEIESEQVNQYNLFYRYHFLTGAEGRLWAGATDDGDGVFGGDAHVILSDRSALQFNFNYLIPSDDQDDLGIDQESWALGFNLVLYPARTGLISTRSRYRPLFNVADNATFFTRR